MNKLLPLPLYAFLEMVVRNGGIDWSRIKNATPWLIKSILFEPIRWIELAAYHQRIAAHEIRKHPLFILGYYRSGTSYLHQCLVQDDRLGYHTNYQMVLPEVMLTTEKALLPVFDAICRIFGVKDSVHRVPLSFRFPGEEDATMTTYLDPRGAQWGYFFPEKMPEQFSRYVLFENIPVSEKEAWDRSFLYLLRKISIANGGKQLVLKSPPHTARIPHLLGLFPQAKFLFIHRNPYEVYLSNQRFWRVLQKEYALQTTRSVDVNAIILDTYSKMMQSYLYARNSVPHGQLAELSYSDFVKAPVSSLRNVYQELQLDDFGYCEQKLERFTGAQRQFVPLKHEMRETEKKLVTEKLEPFLRQWNYPLL